MDELHQIRIQNFRSLRDLFLPIANPCVVTGGNGTGKSNLYKALELIQHASVGQFARAITDAGGMPSLMWAGKRNKQDLKQLRVRIELDLGNWRYDIAAGLPTPNEGAFPLDPRVKEENLNYLSVGGRRSSFLKRSKLSVKLRDTDNQQQTRAFEILGSESALSQIAEPELYPELSRLRESIRGWRFYHHFDTRPGSLLRQPQIGTMTPLLATNGEDLPSALASLWLMEEFEGLASAFSDAFPGHGLHVIEDKGLFSFEVSQPGLMRNLKPDELSDGTLRYICLLAALKGLRLPTLLVLNEPEMSLHADLLPPLADLLIEASRSCQLIVVTHAGVLAEQIAAQCDVSSVMLTKEEGETKIVGQQWDGSLGSRD